MTAAARTAVTRTTPDPAGGDATHGASQPSPAAGRLAFLDGIRALAALSVVVHHVYLTVTGDGSIRRHLPFLRYGNFAVAAFIVVSGYSLALASSRRKNNQRFGPFIRRRAWRILPPYLAALALSTLLILTLIGSRTGTPWDQVLPLSRSGVGVNALLLQDVVSARAPNHVFWSIAVEWHLYLLFPLLLAVRRRAARPWLVLVGALGCGLLWLGYAGRPYVGFPPQFFGLFVLGILAGDLATDGSDRGHRLRSWFRPGWTIVAVTLGFPLAVMWVRADPSYFVAETILGGALAAFLVSMSSGPINHPAKRMLEWRPLTRVGVFSYSLYLTHAPILQIVWQHGIRPFRLGPNIELTVTMFVATLASLAGGFAFHLVFERPFMRHRSVRATAGALKARWQASDSAPDREEALAASPSPDDIAFLRRRLNEALSVDERVSAIRAMAQAAAPDQLDALTLTLADPDARVRAVAVDTLPVSGTNRAATQLMAAAEDRNETVRAASHRRLASAPSWILWMAFGRCTRRPEMLAALEEAAPRRSAELILERVSSPDPCDRILAVELAGHLRTPSLLAEAARTLTDADPSVRRTAAAQLSGEEQGIPGLVAALRDDHVPVVRQEAARSLGDMGSETILSALTEALQDPHAGVRNLAAEVLLRHRPPRPSGDRVDEAMPAAAAHPRPTERT